MATALNSVLRILRQRAHTEASLTQVAKGLGVSKEYLSKVETGALARPSKEVFEKMLADYECVAPAAEVMALLYQCSQEGKLPDELDIGTCIAEDARFRLVQAIRGLKGLRRTTICFRSVSEPVLEGRSESTYILTQPALLNSFGSPHYEFAETLGLLDKEWNYHRLLHLILDENSGVSVSWDSVPPRDTHDVTILDGLPLVLRHDPFGETFQISGEEPASSRTFAPAFGRLEDVRERILTPEQGVEFVHKTRLLANELRNVKNTLGELHVVRDGPNVRVEPRGEPKAKSKSKKRSS